MESLEALQCRSLQRFRTAQNCFDFLCSEANCRLYVRFRSFRFPFVSFSFELQALCSLCSASNRKITPMSHYFTYSTQKKTFVEVIEFQNLIQD